ncbi:hypothetical protein ACHAWO_006788 [Cyclotella atomus]|uniref:Nudix hydrolase domain-containing protein n=1 Tax=Cyclotella atomus TaxID=382360 RepID=A0ABD3N033_9STRA
MAPSADDDYKAFILPISKHGILLLYCTRKNSKGPHHQLPGGHVDTEDFDQAAKMNPNAIGTDHLLQACKIGAARELFEETGMDLRSTIDRLVPIQVRQSSDDEGKLLCQFKKRIFFSVEVSEYDFFTKGAGFVKAMNKNLSHLKLKLSHEHQGFVFEPSLAKAADLLNKHSGGKITTALKTAIELGSINYTEPEQPELDNTERIESKELPPLREEKNILDCFNCWK